MNGLKELYNLAGQVESHRDGHTVTYRSVQLGNSLFLEKYINGENVQRERMTHNEIITHLTNTIKNGLIEQEGN